METDTAVPRDAGLFQGAHDISAPAPDSRPQTSDSHTFDRDEADTCRICRGEGTAEEPLFYPCKCSGSIKYVHQECLMEWLSHTQKKHCELCKTSFRFTKLYHPGMPNRIPTSVFIRRAALHVLNMFFTWCRGILVGSVWLFLLPWCMRVVWRSLFWVGDGGWSGDMIVDAARPTAALQHSLPETPAVLASSDAANASANATLANILHNTSGLTVWGFVKAFLVGVPWPFAQLAQIVQLTQYPLHDVNGTTSLNATSHRTTLRSPSLLSDVPFLNWFQSQPINRFCIDVLEGQIITLIVVVAFILIFLIREWVVQQQPVINMVALGDDMAAQRPVEENNQERQEAAEVENEEEHVQEDEPDNAEAPEVPVNVPQREDREPTIRRVRRSSSLRRRKDDIMRRLGDDEIQKEIKDVLRTGSAEDITETFDRLGIADSPKLQDFIAAALSEHQPHGQSSVRSDHDDSVYPSTQRHGAAGPSNADLTSPPSDGPQHTMATPTAAGSNRFSLRPNMPSRDRSSFATGIQRDIEESESWSFAALPQRSASGADEEQHIPDSWEDESATDPQPIHVLGAGQDETMDSEHSSGSWQQVPDVIMSDDSDQALEGARAQDKGKAKVVDERADDSDVSTRAMSTAHRYDSDMAEPDADATVWSNSLTASTTLHDSMNQDETTEQGMEEHEDNTSASSTDGSDLRAGLLELGQEQQPINNAPTAAEPAVQAQVARPPITTLDALLDWMFGDIVPAAPAVEDAGNDEQIVRNVADEAPFVPFLGNEPRDHGNARIQDAEVAAAAAQAGIDVNDQEAIEDAEDLEGILELIGMQGPIVGLFQNALFSAVLISATLGCAVWLPYLWGKVVLLFMGSPVSLLIKLPLQLIATMTDLIVDLTLFLVAGVTYSMSATTSLMFRLLTGDKLFQTVQSVLNKVSFPARSLAASAMDRIAKLIVESPITPRPDYFRLSVNSHAALRSIQNSTSFALNETSSFVNTVVEEIAADSPFQFIWRLISAVPFLVYAGANTVSSQAAAFLSWVWSSKSYKITLDLDLGHNVTEAYTAMEQWTASDRMIAIFAGYGFFALAGAIYLKRGSPFSSSQQGQRVERIISDILQQAGGVLKVILIISIEMLAFPLYCGLLLDLAMLPLFKNATLYTRWQFTQNSPWTSGFVHWFIGTCYMFHFALFVSMCRKIMRKGVLYFIRDPDDPTFHPVRDVLERSVTTQLRKIAFSALVYGALVIVCLGGVVWTLSRITSDVLPIHWTTEAPSLEFPLDLLFYNFLTPVIIRFYKPSDGLHAIFTWWFKTCAAFLRLTNFLFDEKIATQEHPGGRYVRAPASDQARIPKGQAVFVEVTYPENVRKDGITEGGVHNNPELVTVVYIPPWFRVRVFCFVVTIWIFMGLSGVGVTIVPLLFGRFLFSLFLPSTVEMNDIHAFSLGIYTLGAVMYSVYSLYKVLSQRLTNTGTDAMSTFHTIRVEATRVGKHVLRFTYVWGSLVFAIPFLFAILIELYFLMPLHAYLGPSEPHVVHIIQDWTLGFLYARLAARLVFANRDSRPARAFAAIVRNGYLYPNAAIATRCFVLPVLVLFLIAIAIPGSLALLTNATLYFGATAATRKMVWRFSFPAVGMSVVAIWASNAAIRLLVRWRLVVRDEVYLIGERLHNFGEKKAPEPVVRAEDNTVLEAGVEEVLVQ
ncbi:hypothetical protein ACN47E_004454 [Coniothyrium glycines]